jgi:hypothetical protein
MRSLTIIVWILLSAPAFSALYGQEPALSGSVPLPDTTLIDDVSPGKPDEPSPQHPKTDKSAAATALPANLADALTRALRSNPDIQLAIAHLDEVQAQRDQTRLKVVELVSRAVHEYQLGTAARDAGRAPRLQDVRARLAYLLGAGNDESPEQLAEEQGPATNAERLAGDLARNLGKAIARALLANPDLRLADAKVRAARAELNQVKLATAQKVTIAFDRWQSERAQFDAAEKQRWGVMSARLDLAEAEADFVYLLGGPQPATDDAETATDSTDARQRVSLERVSLDSALPATASSVAKRPAIPAQYAELMKKPVHVQLSNSQVGLVLAQWNEETGGELRIVENLGAAVYDLDLPGEVPLATALEILADLTDCAFVFRDYGLLAVRRAEAWKYSGATIPADAPLTAGGR